MEGSIIGVNSYDLQELVSKVVELNKIIGKMCGISEQEMEPVFDEAQFDQDEKQHKGKKCVNLDTLEQFDSLRLAAKSIGIKNSSSEISAVCRGKVPDVYGHHFAYYDDYINNRIPKYKGKWDESVERGRKLADMVKKLGVTNKELADFMCLKMNVIQAYYTRPTEETVERVLDAAKKIKQKRREDIWWKCKRYIKENGVHCYEVALVMGINQPELSKRLRNADENMYEQIVGAVTQILKMKEYEETSQKE